MSAIDWTPYSEEGLTAIWLGWAYRSRHSGGDRRPEGEQPWEVDGQLGVPTSQARLATGGHVRSGIEVVLRTPHFPQKWAANLILTDQGEAYWRIPRDKWPADVASDIAELTYRWQKWALAAAGHGWVALKPPLVWEPTRSGSDPKQFASGVGPDGLPWVWHATHLALEAAEEMIPRDYPEQMRGPRSALATASPEDREYAAKVAPWYADEAKREDGAGV